MKRIGTEKTEVLDYTPTQLYVVEYLRHKYIAIDTQWKEQILIGQLPFRAIDKGIAGPGLLSQVYTDKYVDHIPLHRQCQRYARQKRDDTKLHNRRMSGKGCDLLDPLHEILKKDTLASDYLQVDESGILVLTKDKPESKVKGCMQIYHAVNKGLCFFLYTQTKEKENLIANLKT